MVYVVSKKKKYMVLNIKLNTNKFMEYIHHVLLYSIHGTWCPI